MVFLNPIEWKKCNTAQKQALLMRPSMTTSKMIQKKVFNILEQVKLYGDQALYDLNYKFDNLKIKKLRINHQQITDSKKHIQKNLKKAMKIAYKNINKFHKAQVINPINIETQSGIICEQIIRPIESVGLYIPAGSVPLFSTVLMLSIPANIAGCCNIIICSPPPISNQILYAAYLCGIKNIFQVGGAQAIAALAFGSTTIPKVDKIFGPGNIYVTEAKRQVSQRLDGSSIDMLAGPSELLIIADDYAIPSFVASDLLSQAEHGLNSQVILLTTSLQLAKQVSKSINDQLRQLKNNTSILNVLNNSRIIITCDLQQCAYISNLYAPEHLSIQINQPRKLVTLINNAGSIFLGHWSPESVGDYASGTNHVLPTYGNTKTFSSLGLADFQKRMTVQELTPNGLLNIAKTIEILATAENLSAHKHSVTLRIKSLKGR
ncbi:MAG: histidinol dehydrogenase [Pantoea sp. Brub]|nr:histidinol dehydrogenase [Pantoea sp. Brub]